MAKEPKIFSALIYYRATKGWIKIQNDNKTYLWGLIKTNNYKLIET